jgi:hypothetical protein
LRDMGDSGVSLATKRANREAILRGSTGCI